MGNVNFSLEVTTKSVLTDLPNLKDIYITFLPDTEYQAVADQAKALCALGYNAIPHIPARSITNLDMLKDYVRQIKDAGVNQVLVIGGDRDILGDYHSSMQLIETGLLEGMKIGIAGHPEGSPNMSDEIINEALKQKEPYVDYIVTQWTQDVSALKQYVATMPLPVHVGLAGPASLKTLVKFAGFVGLKNTISFAKKNATKILDLLSVQTPDEVIHELKDSVDNFHIYAFGGIKKTNEWLTKENYYV
jgi:methylenetetrahydrofolate reductase (NADPH)|tara:strand:+ start:13414 stop:14154 length:741 start_codon:yes stop_codon:yes gene_type:complete